MVKEINFIDLKQRWKVECSEVSLEFFMENYCNQLLEKNKEIHVIVSPNFKFVFK